MNKKSQTRKAQKLGRNRRIQITTSMRNMTMITRRTILIMVKDDGGGGDDGGGDYDEKNISTHLGSTNLLLFTAGYPRHLVVFRQYRSEMVRRPDDTHTLTHLVRSIHFWTPED